MSKENFKQFAVKNTALASHVNNGSMTWQRFYEMYEMYGENNNIWSSYLTNDPTSNRAADTSSSGKETTVKDLVNMVKSIELEKVQKGIDGIQRTISLIQELGGSKASESTYEPRPIYKHLSD